VHLTKTLRVSRDGELEGLDIHEHGTPAYHMEFGQGMSYTAPAGLPPQLRTPVGVGAASPPPAPPSSASPSGYSSGPPGASTAFSSDESPPGGPTSFSSDETPVP